MAMSPEERRTFMQQAAPGLPMPSSFESAELAEQFSDQFNQGMADILKTLSTAAATNLATLPPVTKVPQLTAGGGAKVLSKEAQRGIRSLEKQIAAHEKKLADFKANPTVRPGMEGQSREVIEAAQQSRIRHLEKEIQTFRENIEKLKEGK
jgi:hypothetical protein